jgi:hypothetical protein
MEVALAESQDEPDRFPCASWPLTGHLTVSRDGAVIAEADGAAATFEVPAGPGAYRVEHVQEGRAPYPQRSTTAWEFPSAAPPAGGPGRLPLPLLVVDYDLPLDTLNRPTGRLASLAVDQVAGAADSPVTGLEVWTSLDDGATWQAATTLWQGAGRYRVMLPRAEPGTGVSLRARAADRSGSRVEQVLVDAYTA